MPARSRTRGEALEEDEQELQAAEAELIPRGPFVNNGKIRYGVARTHPLQPYWLGAPARPPEPISFE